MLDFPVAPPIFIKDTPHKRKLTTLAEARAFVDEMLHQRRLYKLREVKTRLEILPYHANPRRMEFPERTGPCTLRFWRFLPQPVALTHRRIHQ